MNRWSSGASLFVLLTIGACSAAAPAPPPTQTQPESAAAPAVDQAPTSESIARADALLEDFKRREVAQAKFDRENPPPKFVPIPRTLIEAAQASATSTASNTSPTAPPADAVPGQPALPAASASARDELWWRRQMQSLQQALDDATVRLAEAEKSNFKYGYNDSQAEYKKRADAVTSARRAIQSLHDEARRAGVPPGWLR